MVGVPATQRKPSLYAPKDITAAPIHMEVDVQEERSGIAKILQSYAMLQESRKVNVESDSDSAPVSHHDRSGSEGTVISSNGSRNLEEKELNEFDNLSVSSDMTAPSIYFPDHSASLQESAAKNNDSACGECKSNFGNKGSRDDLTVNDEANLTTPIVSTRECDKFNHHQRKSTVRFEEEDEDFRPSYEIFTPKHQSLQKVKYIAPENRMVTALGPPSSVSWPNHIDTMRRVSVVLFQHIQKCERKVADMNKACSYDVAKAELFHDKHFILPKYRCIPLRTQGLCVGVPSLSFVMKKMDVQNKAPEVENILEFIQKLFDDAFFLNSECAIVSLIYIERLMEVAAIPLLSFNWKPILLCGLILASKVWQERFYVYNGNFSEVYPEFSVKNLNRLERIFVSQIQWNLYIDSSLYAKYYFALRSITEQRNFRQKYNYIVKIKAPDANRIEVSSKVLREEIAKFYSKSY